jgi:OmpA-OmpF porin, OOP family
MMDAAAQQITATDGDWSVQQLTLFDTQEADIMYRVGDIDNLGFGWGEGFDPFCSSTTDPHDYPWEPQAIDLPGLDRILISSAYDPNKSQACAGDGYSGTYDSLKSKPLPIILNTPELKNKPFNNAHLQLFIDDFQAPSFCSKFQFTLNGKRFIEAERLLNAIEQGGPVGKLITVTIPEEFYPILKSGNVSLLIDEVNGAADGFAIDFAKLIINRHLNPNCSGSVVGWVYDLETREPIGDAIVKRPDGTTYISEVTGYLLIKNAPTGMEIISATAMGYREGFATADIGIGEENESFTIYLERDRSSAIFDGQSIGAGQVVNLNKILFDQGSAKLRPESKIELDLLAEFLQTNTNAEIELSGHTSSEGDPQSNRSLSYQRVKACKDYITAKGIDTARITTVGLGADRPIALNDTEPNRAKNRRVELRVLKLQAGQQ